MHRKLPTRYRITQAVAVSILVASVLISSVAANEKDSLGAVYNHKVWKVVIDGNKFKKSVDYQITINSPRGEDYKDLHIYESHFSKLKKVQVIVYDGAGKKLYKRGKKDFLKVCGFSGLYSDVCRYYLSVPAPRMPYTISFKYEMEFKSLFSWRGAYFQSGIPVKLASYSLTVPNDFVFEYKVRGMELQPTVRSDKKKKHYTWLAENLDAVPNVDYVPPDENKPIKLDLVADQFEVSGYKLDACTWHAIGDWYRDLAADKYLKSHGVTSGSPSDFHRAAQNAYDAVISNTRYVAIEIGIGGWQPYSAELTQKRGYGDCKDMSTLLISRLRNQGIEAYPCLVLTRDKGPIDTDFPSNNFNHVVAVAVHGDDTVWMDPTCDDCPYGDLRRDVEDMDVLVVTESGGEVWHTPASTPQENRTSRTTALRVEADYSIQFETSMEVTGNFAAGLRRSLPHMDNDRKRRYMNQIFRGAERLYRIESFTIQNLDDFTKPLKIGIKARFLKKPRRIGPVVYLDPYTFGGLSSLEREPLKKRRFGLDLFYPKLVEDNISVVWDSGLGIDSVVMPKDDSTSASFGFFSHRVSHDSNTVSIEVTKQYSAYSLGVEDFEEFKRFRERVKRITTGHIKLIVHDDQK